MISKISDTLYWLKSQNVYGCEVAANIITDLYEELLTEGLRSDKTVETLADVNVLFKKLVPAICENMPATISMEQFREISKIVGEITALLTKDQGIACSPKQPVDVIVSRKEAINLAKVNNARIESMLKLEVERDASTPDDYEELK